MAKYVVIVIHQSSRRKSYLCVWGHRTGNVLTCLYQAMMINLIRTDVIIFCHEKNNITCYS